jgi:hypothetical protein
MSEYRVLVTGSREWTRFVQVWEALDAVAAAHGGPLIVVHGACPSGADDFARQWALTELRHGLPVRTEPHPADWDGPLGKGAGCARNQVMVDLGADVCLAFFRNGAGNRGTSDCAARAEAAGIPVRRFYE